jgi:uncharacterized membrane protein YqhA
MNNFANGFGSALWRGRFVVMVGVVCSFVVALVLFYITTVDVVYTVMGVAGYANPALEATARARMGTQIIARVAGIFDGYLFAAILIIFAIGLYELFIRRLSSSADGSNVLLVRNLDDLKERLAKVVFLILLVRYFEYALELPVQTPTDLLYLAVGIGIVAFAIFIASRRAQS